MTAPIIAHAQGCRLAAYRCDEGLPGRVEVSGRRPIGKHPLVFVVYYQGGDRRIGYLWQYGASPDEWTCETAEDDLPLQPHLQTARFYTRRDVLDFLLKARVALALTSEEAFDDRFRRLNAEIDGAKKGLWRQRARVREHAENHIEWKLARLRYLRACKERFIEEAAA